ncbi:MAG: hypothetical protein ING59_16395 [Burkholderiales bacterium]|nr:hypothetical protein [Burkholderiales bacterium]
MDKDMLRGLAWKGYTLLLIALVVLPLPFGAMTPGAWAGAAIGLVLCLPMIAFAWRKAFVPSWLSKTAFIVTLVVIGVSGYASVRMHGAAGLGASVAVLAVLLPYLVATFRQGFGGLGSHGAQTAH